MKVCCCVSQLKPVINKTLKDVEFYNYSDLNPEITFCSYHPLSPKFRDIEHHIKEGHLPLYIFCQDSFETIATLYSLGVTIVIPVDSMEDNVLKKEYLNLIKLPVFQKYLK